MFVVYGFGVAVAVCNADIVKFVTDGAVDASTTTPGRADPGPGCEYGLGVTPG